MMKINKEGYRIVLITLVVAVAVAVAGFLFTPRWVAWALTALMAGKVAFVLYFFRQPTRERLEGDGMVFAPADGEVVVVEEVAEEEYLHGRCIQVSVFMSLWNVHMNWFPVAGRVAYFRYHPGRFLVAWHPKSSTDNERTTTVVDTGREKVLFRQIAGFVARRIVSYAQADTEIQQNTPCGFIKFGSRVDLFLPLDTEITVRIGDRVIGSQTVIAKLKR